MQGTAERQSLFSVSINTEIKIVGGDAHIAPPLRQDRKGVPLVRKTDVFHGATCPKQGLFH